jgi:parallel beta-helix repeat protein
MLILATSASAKVIVVSTTIQAAVDAAQPGDTVQVPKGTYRENVLVTRDNITIEAGPGAVLDGTGLAGNTGIKVVPPNSTSRITGFVLSGLTIRNFSQNRVLLKNADDFRLTGGTYIDNDEYGIFPIQSSGGLIDHNFVSGSDDTGIYVGQSHDILVKKNRAIDCTVGIEIELSSRIDVRNNTARGNTIGIVVQIVPGLSISSTSDINITGNKLVGDNRANPVTDPNELMSRLPSGIGFLNVGGDRVIVQGNTATDNNSAGIVVTQLPPQVAALDPRLDPFPDANQIRDNVVMNNGDSPDPKLAPFPGADLLWDLTGAGNCWTGNQFRSAFPALPSCP